MGFWFDPLSGMFYPDDTDNTPVSNFTFNDLWNISKIVWFKDQPLNPFYTPTQDTAVKVFQWAQKVAGPHALLTLKQEPIKHSPFAKWSHPEWSIYAERTNFEGSSDGLSVGLLASQLIRNGEIWPARALEAELRGMGAWA